jgi:hypothetical protein
MDDLLLGVSFLSHFRRDWSFYMLCIPSVLLLGLSGSFQGIVARLYAKVMLVIQALGWVFIRRPRHGD